MTGEVAVQAQSLKEIKTSITTFIQPTFQVHISKMAVAINKEPSLKKGTFIHNS